MKVKNNKSIKQKKEKLHAPKKSKNDISKKKLKAGVKNFAFNPKITDKKVNETKAVESTDILKKFGKKLKAEKVDKQRKVQGADFSVGLNKDVQHVSNFSKKAKGKKRVFEDRLQNSDVKQDVKHLQKLDKHKKGTQEFMENKRKDSTVKKGKKQRNDAVNTSKDAPNVSVTPPEPFEKKMKSKKNGVGTNQPNTSSENNDSKQMLEVEVQAEDDVPKKLIKEKTMKTALAACKNAMGKLYEQKKQLFGEDLRYALQIISVKIPDVPTRMRRITFPHPIYTPGDQICLIVKNLERGSKQDPEETIRYWEDKLQKLGVDYITSIIPMQQIKKDYRPFEMRLKLVNRYDIFLTDAHISKHILHLLGSHFIKRRKNPTPVLLHDDEKIAKEIEMALCQQAYKQPNTGKTVEIPFAVEKMPLEHAVENAFALVEYLKTEHPGGWRNIRNIFLKPMAGVKLSFPLYATKIDPNTVPVPHIPGPREKNEQLKNEILKAATLGKYYFQAGSLVRTPYKERQIERKTKAPKAELEQQRAENAEAEAEESSGDEDKLDAADSMSSTDSSDIEGDDTE